MQISYQTQHAPNKRAFSPPLTPIRPRASAAFQPSCAIEGAADPGARRGDERGRTTFVITHLVVTIREADLILTFAQGRIVESGTFDALVAGSGIFARLAEAQFIAKTSAPAT